MTALDACGPQIGLGAKTARARTMAASGLDLRRPLSGLRWRCPRRRVRLSGIGLADDTGAGRLGSAWTRSGRGRRRRGLKRLAKEPAAKPAHRDLACLPGKHSPQTQADDLLQSTRPCRWHMTLMHWGNETLALVATQGHIVRGPLPASSFDTPTLAWRREGGDVTIAGKLGKPRPSPGVVLTTGGGLGGLPLHLGVAWRGGMGRGAKGGAGDGDSCHHAAGSLSIHRSMGLMR
jgi:hypothetical protein